MVIHLRTDDPLSDFPPAPSSNPPLSPASGSNFSQRGPPFFPVTWVKCKDRTLTGSVVRAGLRVGVPYQVIQAIFCPSAVPASIGPAGRANYVAAGFFVRGGSSGRPVPDCHYRALFDEQPCSGLLRLSHGDGGGGAAWPDQSGSFRFPAACAIYRSNHRWPP